MVTEPQSEIQPTPQEILLPPGYTQRPLTATDVPEIHERLEKLWAPFLRYSLEDYNGQVKVFPEGQQVVFDDVGDPVATLSTNRYQIDDINHLPSWDSVAGMDKYTTATFERTYNPKGNAVILMSMSVREDQRGKQLASFLAQAAIKTGKDLRADYVLGPFRPSSYGEFKKRVWSKLNTQATGEDRAVDQQEYLRQISFDKYCELTREDGEPIDPWLRSLHRLGMKPLQTHPESMRVVLLVEEFNKLKTTWNKEKWYATDLDENHWECEETGSWNIMKNDAGEGIAVYTESNKWGLLYKASS